MIDVEEFKMKEIVKIEESDSHDELTVTFTDSKTMKIKIVDENHQDYVYPDASITCMNESSDQYIEHPKLIVEVLSKSTARYDQIDKFRKYQKLNSLEDYVLIDQYLKRVDVYRKSEESDLKWIIQTYIGGEVLLPSIDFKTHIDEFYTKVTFGR